MKLPLDSEYVNRFDVSEHVLQESDWDVLLEYVQVNRMSQLPSPSKDDEVLTFAESLKEKLLMLPNDLALTCVMRLVDPLSCTTSIEECAAALFPKHTIKGTIDFHRHQFLTLVKEKTVPGFDVVRAESGILGFLTRHCSEHTLISNSAFISGVRQYVEFVFAEILELASNHAVGSFHVYMVPSNIKQGIFGDPELLCLFKYRKLF